MVRPASAPLLAAAALALAGQLGCDAPAGLAWLGMRSIREVPASDAAAWLDSDRAVVVQVRHPDERLAPLPGAHPMRPEDPLPDALGKELGSGRWLLVVGSQDDEALRLAARLSRAGLSRVAVVRGDASALAGLRTAVRRVETQPPAPDRHPTN